MLAQMRPTKGQKTSGLMIEAVSCRDESLQWQNFGVVFRLYLLTL